MGHLVAAGRPLEWKETAPLADNIRSDGIRQFLRILADWRSRPDDRLLWGDELEFPIVERVGAHWQPFCGAAAMVAKLKEERSEIRWNYEYGSYMIEAVPESPFMDGLECLEDVGKSMRERWMVLSRAMGADKRVLLLTNLPRLGAEPTNKFINAITRSDYVDDSLINQCHPRFASLARNIRARRDSKVDIRLPVYQDTMTAPDLKEIHMDAMTFGMGCCCLQLTFQTRNITDARRLFDQLVMMAPIMMAVAAAAPVYRGILADADCRWKVVSGSVDDRTDEERDKNNPKYISKSRYASISRYLDHLDFNDLNLVYNERVLGQLSNHDIDEGLKMHLAHLFIRDPLVVFSDSIRVDNNHSTEHFDNLQSTNWQTVRFKPPASSKDGWRVEFRPLDLQLRIGENAALAVWCVLFSRVILRYPELDYCIPISLVDENMERADKPDAIKNERFWFKTNDGSRECSIDEIVCEVDGIMRLYLQEQQRDHPGIIACLDFVRARARGHVPTNAREIRDFIKGHPKYRKDSIVSDEIADDLIDWSWGLIDS